VGKIKAIILDLDQTLTTDEASWLQFTELIGADKKAHTKIFEDYKSGELEYIEAKEKLIKLWETTGRTHKDDILEAFKKVRFREGVVDAVKYLSQKYTLCIISGAIDTFVEVASKQLEIEHHYAATKFKYDKSGYLVDFEYKLSRGEEKLEYLKIFCNKTGIKPNVCAAIGDGDSDVPIFGAVGLPILFIAEETSEELRKEFPLHLKNWNEIQKVL
jgi:phosphoserine phosphatase